LSDEPQVPDERREPFGRFGLPAVLLARLQVDPKP
jgi:hypothetical protein